MRWSFVASLIAAALVAGTSASEAVPARGVEIGAAAKSVQLTDQVHYKRHVRHCPCPVVHRPKKVFHKAVVHRKHVVRRVVVVDEPEVIVRRRFVVHRPVFFDDDFVDRPFFFRRARFAHRPFFRHAHFGHRRFFHHGHFGHRRFGHFGHRWRFAGHGRFGRW
jgi:hypothetical protein